MRPRTRLSSLRTRLALTVFIAVAPAWVFMFVMELPWLGMLVGLAALVAALVAAWLGGERFVLQQLRNLHHASRKLGEGDLATRTGLADTPGEIGELARTFDQMAAALEERGRESEATSQALLNRALQQTVVAALGQFALVSHDLKALLDQAVQLVAQTLETEFCKVLELRPEHSELVLRAGVGWKTGAVNHTRVSVAAETQAGFTLSSGEPVVITDLRSEKRFSPNPFLLEHGVRSGVSVPITTRHRTYGVLGVFTNRTRQFTEDEAHFLFSVATVIGMAAERHRSESDLRKLAAFAQLNPNPALELGADASITYFNDSALKLALAVRRSHPREYLPADIAVVVQDCLEHRRSRQLETKFEDRTLAWSLHPVVESRVVHCYVEDITERLSLEARFLQSQKMESVGQLAAGVAHDFNNMLTVIQGHAGLMLAQPNLTERTRDSAQAVHFAAERAAGLTRQLLMFSRKSVMQARPLDLREVLGNLSKMLRRLLGETITLEFKPPAQLAAIHADPGMIEQVLMNLAVNARDAMPDGGTLTLNVRDVEVTPEFAQRNPEARGGRFVCLRVTDVGCGMDEATRARIFEPFFTTKEVGKGTGLGLATVYGIVKQHEGWIEVASAVGKGTSFTIFLPACPAGEKTEPEDSDPQAFVRGGTETVLVVEDEPVVRDMAAMILEESGYRVLTASAGPEALEQWENEFGRIDLLLTDMVMPEGMSGVNLARRLLARSPRLKLIFASGYTVDEVSTTFLRQHNNARFLQKPYTRTQLAREVRRVLDHPASPPTAVGNATVAAVTA